MTSIALPDAIRVVALDVPAPLHPQPPAGMTYRGGPLISNVAISVVYWGTYWAAASASLTQQIDDFFSYIVTSPLIGQLAEYDAGGYHIGNGSLRGSTLISPPTGASITDAEIQAQLRSMIAAVGQTPPPVSNELRFVFFPPGVQVVMGGQQSCASFCGYHNDIDARIYYAVVPYPDCGGCLAANVTFDAITRITSHELCEAITDPVPGTGWYDNVRGEIGDVCNAQPKPLGPYVVQKIWSNQRNQCI